MNSTACYQGLFFPKIGPGIGFLSIAGEDSLLKLSSKEPWQRDASTAEFIDFQDTLNDGRKASLIQCICTGSTRFRADLDTRYEDRFFPHYIVIGETFVSSTEPAVRAVHYHFENAHCLIGGRAFDSIRIHPDELRKILDADHLRGEEIARKHGFEQQFFQTHIGEHPELLYFNGVWEIAKCKTDIGTVSLVNRTLHNSGSAKSIGIENEVTAILEFSTLSTIPDTVFALRALHSLLELILGRRQRYLWIELELNDLMTGIDSDLEIYQRANFYWSYCNDQLQGQTKETHYGDILIDAERRPEEFGQVTSKWLNSSDDMGRSRERFATAFYSPYSVNRLVGAANMFDLLPERYVPLKRDIDIATKDAVQKCRNILITLPKSSTKDVLLTALGKIGTASLSEKVLNRAGVIIASSGSRFPELQLPCRQAVACRNYYVHGREAAFDYDRNFNEFAFLTDTLEFVFAVSDLIELGWDFENSCKKKPLFSHPFGFYVISYSENLQRLKSVLQAN